jgi:hypothetical protein
VRDYLEQRRTRPPHLRQVLAYPGQDCPTFPLPQTKQVLSWSALLVSDGMWSILWFPVLGAWSNLLVATSDPRLTVLACPTPNRKHSTNQADS